MNIINLTNGLEWLPVIGEPSGYARLQSSHLEGGHWQRFVDSVDNDMLWHLARGEKVYLCDCGSRRADGVPRTIWQGIPMVRWCCERAWGLEPKDCFVKEHNVTGWMVGLRLDLRKYRYFAKYCSADRIQLVGRSFRSTLDGRQRYSDRRLVL